MRKEEKGLSSISLVVAVAVAAIIAVGAGITVTQILMGTDRNEQHIEAVRQAQNLGRFFSRDAMMADDITAGDDLETADEELVSMYWKDWANGDTCNVRYLWLDDVDSSKRVKRNVLERDKDGIVTDNTTTIIAYRIYSANITQDNDTWILNVETDLGSRNLLREYKVTDRLS
jgi:type II secretory pathway pseudopilin PulG